MEKEVYKGQIIRVTEEEIGGINWERAYTPDGVVVFPITKEGKIILIEESRPHENPPVRIKPVSGILEHDNGTPLENAQREMQEEIGYKSLRMESLWTLNGSGTINSSQYYFIAYDLVPSKLPNPDGEDVILRQIEISPEELFYQLKNDQLKWSLSTLGIFRLLLKLGVLS